MEYMSLKDYVYQYIAKEIRQGNLGGNEKVNEQEICDQLNISRTPVREALIQLSADGFLESSPRRGFRVKPLTVEEAENIYEVLSRLDELAVELCMNRLDEEDYKAMEDLIALMDFHIERGQFDQYQTSQEKFHNRYIQKANNGVLIDIIHRLQRRFIREGYGDKDEEKMKEHLRKKNLEHKKMLTLFREKKGEELTKLLRENHWTYTAGSNLIVEE